MGQKLKVRVLEVDLERKRISLSCKKEDAGYVDRKHSASSGQRSQTRKPRQSQPQPMKNNAFAALKGLKINS